MEKLQKMSKPEKKKFLSMDLAERMIRVEQNVSSAFNKSIPYNQTEYYKSMTSEEKEEFETFLKNKGKKKWFSILALILPVIALIVLSTGITGNVVKESLGGSYSLLIIGLFVIVVVLALVLVLAFSKKKNMEKKFNSHASVINNLMITKSMTKKV